MNTINKKAYVYQMKLLPANLLSIIIFILLCIPTYILFPEGFSDKNPGLFLLMLLGYMLLHEFLHGIGYWLGGVKRKNIQYGICLEKGIFYAMAYEELSKKSILISLQMPFMVIGVITYVFSMIFHLPVLAYLSVFNLMGASMDLVMFFYLLKIKDVTYSESGQPDQFVLMTSEDLEKRKSIFLKIVNTKSYHKKDYEFSIPKKIQISKASFGILLFLIILSILFQLF